MSELPPYRLSHRKADGKNVWDVYHITDQIYIVFEMFDVIGIAR